MRISIIKALLIIAVCSIIFAPLNAKADTVPKFQFTLSPAYANKVVQPGSLSAGSLAILNQGQNVMTYGVYSTPYSVKGEEYTPDFTVLPAKPNISNWFTLSSKSGVLLPNTQSVISYTINVPSSAPGGGYYGAIFVQTTTAKTKQASNNIQANERIGELFYLQVSGPVIEKGGVTSWHAGLFQSNAVNATLRLNDRGGIHYQSNIQITFTDLFGKPQYRTTLQKFVLPYTIRKVNVTWPNPPAFGIYKVSGTATTYGTQKLSTQYMLVISKSVQIKTAISASIILLFILFSSVIRPIIRRVVNSVSKTIKR